MVIAINTLILSYILICIHWYFAGVCKSSGTDISEDFNPLVYIDHYVFKVVGLSCVLCHLSLNSLCLVASIALDTG